MVIGRNSYAGLLAGQARPSAFGGVGRCATCRPVNSIASRISPESPETRLKAFVTMSDIKVFVPTLPTAERLLPYLKAIDAQHWYTNYGPLLARFEVLLAEHFSIGPECVVTAVNGTSALTQILRALGVAKETKCLMPSWSFVATAGAAHAAGLVPFFADVDRQSWSLDPKTAMSLLGGSNVGAVMPVLPFGS